jgi:hypothetical protein
MPRKTGGKIGILLAAQAIAAVRDWDYTEDDVDVDTTAAGDDWEDAESLRGKLVINGTALLQTASPYVIPTSLRGTKFACALKVENGDANGLLTVTAKMSQIKVRARYTDAIEISFQLKTAGAAPVWDLTPAT